MGQENVLNLLDRETAEWFADTLGEPTPVQKEAWRIIAEGKHALISAPTGTGKTLSAFLIFLDRMKQRAKEGTLEQELQLIYVSPLKSLAADIRENLRRPIVGIGADTDICVGIRTGDTPQRERQQMIKKPPHILIITPESLYLMLTSKTGQTVLATAKAVIVDELHALIDTKRGAHLMLSLARLDHLCGNPLQRIGLSATIEPLETAAEYLAPEEVAIAAPDMKKQVRLEILGPYADATKGARKDPVWEELGKLVFQYCQNSRSVIAFVEGRRYAEKLSYYVNLLGGEGFAKVHHGSLSKEQRAETELSLRDGKLRLLCATSSMELGIDVGEIDQVLQVGCPRTISGTMQRLGRAGHNPGRVSVMYLFPRTAAECVSCGMTASLARQGGVEHVKPPTGCLDVLAQHLVSMAAFKSYELSEVMEILPRAWPFRYVTKEDVKSVLSMLAGDYEHDRDIPVRPRILYDRIHEKVEGDGYSRMLAVSAGGTIPDKGLYSVKTQEGVTLGEVDEEFVYETQKGDRFILGSFAWRVVNISRDTVTVIQAQMEGARLPFWHGEIKGRDKRTGEAFGRILYALQKAYEEAKLPEALRELGLDESAEKMASGYLERQIKAAGSLPDHKTIVVEHFKDTVGNSQVMVHSIFGRRVNAPLSLLAAQTIRELTDAEIGSVDEEDGFLLYSYGNQSLPEGILQQIDVEGCVRKLEILLPATPLFNMAFRYNSGRALMMGVRRNGRLPLWMQRLKSAEMLEQVVQEQEHPLMRETRRECLQELWDIKGVQELLQDIRSGAVAVREIYSDIPSPMSLPLQWSQEAAVMYDYAPTPRGIHGAVEEALKKEKNLVQPGSAELQAVQERGRLPQDEKQLHSLLMTEGDLAAGDMDIPVEWLDRLARDGRVLYLEQGVWIAAEQEEEYTAAFGAEAVYGPQSTTKEAERPAAVGQETREKPGREERLHIVRRMLRYRGAADAAQTAARYGLSEQAAGEILEQLCCQGEAVLQDGRYYHGKLYSRARLRTLKNRREEIQTSPAVNYASLMLMATQSGAPAEECLQNTLRQYAGMSFPAAYWEKIILPRRIRNYKESALDSFLAKGELFWHMKDKGEICFDFQADIVWEQDMSSLPESGADKQTPVFGCRMAAEELTEKECTVYAAIAKRGACFMQSLNSLFPGESPYDTLLSLLEKGLLYADSYLPVRQWIDREKTKKAAARQRVNMRVKALQTGRWDIVRPTREKTIEEKLEACFDYSPILCRQTVTACGFSWQEALSVLRIWEYTGQARRGYFVKELSGVQFIRGKDYASVVRSLQEPEQKIIWMNAVDPAQCWGRILPHGEGRNFMCVPGTVVACIGGAPVAVMERQGKVFRVMDADMQGNRMEECLRVFIEEFKRGSIFPAVKRIVVKDYPDTAKEAFAQAGFMKEMQDYVLYR